MIEGNGYTIGNETGSAMNKEPQNFCVFHANHQEIVCFMADGRMLVNAKYSVGELAKLFWDAVRSARPADFLKIPSPTPVSNNQPYSAIALQSEKCGRGEHEPDTAEAWRQFPIHAGVCKHCRCVFYRRSTEV